MNKFVLGIMAACVMAGAAGVAFGAPAPTAQSSDPMYGYYGNTIMSQNQPLYVWRVWFYPDHTFKEFKASIDLGPDQVHISGWEGTWTATGSGNSLEVCKKYNRQPIDLDAALPRNRPDCQTMQSHKVGDVWRVTYNDGPYKGTTETFTVLEGHDAK